MKLTDLNRFGGVGASCHLIEFGGMRLVVDCGFHPKKAGREAPPALEFLRENPPDAILVTHCHLDHLGALPILTREHPNVPVLMSVPSSMLAERLLRNSVNVMKRERAEKGMTDYPLYSMRDADVAMKRVAPMLFGQPRKMSAGEDEIEITFFPAGHVVGAAGIQLVHKHQAVFFTGDVQFMGQLVVGGAQFPSRQFDIVVTETTRGATENAGPDARAHEVMRLMQTIQHTIDRGGSVLMPVFALGRMPEVFLILKGAKERGELPDVPIFAAGLGMDLCNYLDEITTKTGQARFHRSVLRELALKPPSRSLPIGKAPREQGIYVLSSGMLVENTPSYNYATGMIGNHKNSVCFVGYCDPDTPGGKLLQTRQGETFVFEAADFQAKLRAPVERFELTGHAEREELLEFALHSEPRAIVLTHGDPPARAWFEREIQERAPKTKIVNPKPVTTYEV